MSAVELKAHTLGWHRRQQGIDGAPEELRHQLAVEVCREGIRQLTIDRLGEIIIAVDRHVDHHDIARRLRRLADELDPQGVAA